MKFTIQELELSKTLAKTIEFDGIAPKEKRVIEKTVFDIITISDGYSEFISLVRHQFMDTRKVATKDYALVFAGMLASMNIIVANANLNR